MTEIKSIGDINLFADQLVCSIIELPVNVSVTIKVTPNVYVKMMSELHSLINGRYGPTDGGYPDWFSVMFNGIKFTVMLDNV